MYYYNGDPLPLDKAFTDTDGNQYPANWLRNSSQEQRDALGIVWVAPDPAEYYDQRFYWGVGNPKDLAQLQEQWVAEQKKIAGSLLAPTDWYIVRMTEDSNCMCPPGLTQYRADVRAVSGVREAQINDCVDVDELAALITAPATISVVTQEYVPADGENPEVPEVREDQANPDALAAWPTAW
jgi:hypothetical protein